MSMTHMGCAGAASEMHGANRQITDEAQRGTYVVASLPQRAAQVAQQIVACLSDFAYSDRDIVAVEVALGEALSNALRHGNESNPAKKLRISFVVTKEKVWVRIRDQGPGFAADQIPDPTTPENLERLCPGRGLLLMRHFMTRVQFHPPGNCVVMMLERDANRDRRSC